MKVGCTIWGGKSERRGEGGEKKDREKKKEWKGDNERQRRRGKKEVGREREAGLPSI